MLLPPPSSPTSFSQPPLAHFFSLTSSPQLFTISWFCHHCSCGDHVVFVACWCLSLGFNVHCHVVQVVKSWCPSWWLGYGCRLSCWYNMLILTLCLLYALLLGLWVVVVLLLMLFLIVFVFVVFFFVSLLVCILISPWLSSSFNSGRCIQYRTMTQHQKNVRVEHILRWE